VGRSRPRRLLGALRPRLAGMAALALVALGAAGCGVGAESAPEILGAKVLPSGLPLAVRPMTTTVPARDGAFVTVYLEGPRRRLVPVRREVSRPATIAGALDQLADGPTAAEAARALGSPASSLGPFSVRAGRGGVVTVNLPVAFEDLADQDQMIVAGQVVFTVTAFPAVRGVRFVVGGQPSQVPSDRGSLSSAPATRRDYSLLAP
jgi:hypothetical protein